ncbi:hypothetical protein EON65_15375 [archaeon]|nr:MAG: hypothetical protein EON65_15375 [archaeon]
MLDTAKPAPGTPECNYQVSQCGDVPTLWEYTQTTEGMPSSVVYDEQKTSEARPTKQKRGYVNMVSAAKKQRIEEISTDALAPAVIAPDTTAPIVPSVYAAPTPAVSVPGSLQLNMDEVYATYSPSSYASPHSSIAYSPAAYSTSPSSNSLMSQSPYYPSAPSSPFSPLTPLTCPLQQHMYPLSTGYLADSLPYYTHFNTSPNGAGGAMAGVGGGVDGMAGVGAVGSQAEYVPTLLPSLSSLPFAIDVFSGEDPLIVRPHRPSLLPTPSPACKSPTAVNRLVLVYHQCMK